MDSSKGKRATGTKTFLTTSKVTAVPLLFLNHLPEKECTYKIVYPNYKVLYVAPLIIELFLIRCALLGPSVEANNVEFVTLTYFAPNAHTAPNKV